MGGVQSHSRSYNGQVRERRQRWIDLVLGGLGAVLSGAAAGYGLTEFSAEGFLETAPLVVAGMALGGLGLSAYLLVRAFRVGHGKGETIMWRAFQAGSQPYLIMGTNEVLIESNAAFDHLFGRVSGDPMAAIERNLARTEETARAFRRLRALSLSGIASQAEIEVIAADGKSVWYQTDIYPVPDFPGHMTWRFYDVTSRHEMHEAILEEQARITDFIENAPVGFYSLDHEGCFQFANHTFADWLGMTPVQLTSGRRLSDFVKGKMAGDLPYSPCRDPEFRGEVWLMGVQGKSFPAMIAQTVVGEGTNLRTRSVVRDLTPEREWAQALAQSERRFQRFYEAAPIGIILLDMEGRITECNAAMAAILGNASEALTGGQFLDLVVEKQRDEARSVLAAAAGGMENGRPVELHLVGGKEAVVSLFVSRLEDRDGAVSGLLVHALDTTGQKALEVQFAQSQKMQAVGQLAGGIAHDFNNLLTAMIGFCDLLLVRHRPGDQSFADIMQIKQNANRAANLVRQLLAFSRQQTLQPRVLSITDTLAELSNLLRRLIGENIEFSLSHGRDLGLVKADQGQFEQVVINLVVNARDAMAGGGKLAIQTSNLTLVHTTEWGAETASAGEYILVEISDTGSGIEPDVLEHIFEPFFSTKEVGAGTGLGLATVYGILKQTGGFISVDSRPGRGSKFRILLPRHVEEAAEVERTEVLERRQSDLTGVGTVLLVEDEDAVRLFGARALRNKGYKVLEARSGENALELMNSLEDPIDILITDVVMPEMDGPALIQAVREKIPSMRVICISGYAEDSFRRRLDGQPGIHFLPKPFSLDQLAGKVKDVLADRAA
ncbi:MAG: PAS domain-containing protein [Alphaproteobacteria bacterium]